MKVAVKEWFLNKALNQQRIQVLRMECIYSFYIQKETEKAYYLTTPTEYGYISFWCPKSCIISEEEAKQEAMKKIEKRLNAFEYHNQLVEIGKQNKVKGIRKNLKTETLICMLSAEGIAIPKR